jgi:hypothetical protein
MHGILHFLITMGIVASLIGLMTTPVLFDMLLERTKTK